MIILPCLLLSFLFIQSHSLLLFCSHMSLLLCNAMEVEERCLKTLLDTLACAFGNPETSLTWMVACSIVIMIPVSFSSFFPVPNIMENTIFEFRLLLFHFILCALAFGIKLPPASIFQSHIHTQPYSHFGEIVKEKKKI